MEEERDPPRAPASPSAEEDAKRDGGCGTADEERADYEGCAAAAADGAAAATMMAATLQAAAEDMSAATTTMTLGHRMTKAEEAVSRALARRTSNLMT